MPKTIECVICGTTTNLISGSQKTCSSSDCRKALVKKTKRERYEKNRVLAVHKNCIRCGKLVTHSTRATLHPDCKAAKNRERVKAWNEKQKKQRASIKKPRRKTSKPRDFGETLQCSFCNKTVTRRSARQYSCDAKKCKNARKRQSRRRIEEANRIMNPRTCLVCKEPLDKGRRRYHSECALVADKERIEKERLASKPPCGYCGKEMQGKQERKYHRKCAVLVNKARDRKYSIFCEECGLLLDGFAVRFHPECYKKKERRQRRKLSHICGICNDPLDKGERLYHARCRSIAQRRQRRKSPPVCEICSVELPPKKVRYHSKECAKEGRRRDIERERLSRPPILCEFCEKPLNKGRIKYHARCYEEMRATQKRMRAMIPAMNEQKRQQPTPNPRSRRRTQLHALNS